MSSTGRLTYSPTANCSNEASYKPPFWYNTDNNGWIMLTPALLDCQIPEADQSNSQFLQQAQSPTEPAYSNTFSTSEEYSSGRAFTDNSGYSCVPQLQRPYPYTTYSEQNPQSLHYLSNLESQNGLRNGPISPIYDLQSSTAMYDTVETPHCPEMTPITGTSSPFISSPYNGSCFSPEHWQFPTNSATGHAVPCSSPLGQDGEDVDLTGDKPYARLIWEALMQAPGHRMMLKDIYEWFMTHTKKARDSGSNGWQNSIRHNLSMNQAFENDKSDPSTFKGTKKANSVWLLTEDAAKFGVQSTTRYRKTNAVKKSTTSRPPAAQRQRSGAKGGRAAKRAARLRKQEADQTQAMSASHTPPSSLQTNGEHPTQDTADNMLGYEQSPVTPTDMKSYGLLYELPYQPHQAVHHLPAPKEEASDFVLYGEVADDFLFPSAQEPLFDEMSKLRAVNGFGHGDT